MFKEAIIMVGVPIIRSTAGWLNNSLEDGKIQPYELEELAKTTLRILILEGATYLGLTGIGLDPSILATAGSAFLIDKLFMYLKALKKK